MSQSRPSVRMASFGLTTYLPEDQGVPAPHNCPGDPEASYVGRWPLKGIVCRASLGSVPLWFGDDRLAEVPGDRYLGNGVAVMNCQDVRELFSARSSVGIGLTEQALAEAHVTACADCARSEWPPGVEPDSRAVERVIRWLVKAGTSSERLLARLRVPLTRWFNVAATDGIGATRVGITRAIGLVTRLDPFRVRRFKRGPVE